MTSELEVVAERIVTDIAGRCTSSLQNGGSSQLHTDANSCRALLNTKCLCYYHVTLPRILSHIFMNPALTRRTKFKFFLILSSHLSQYLITGLFSSDRKKSIVPLLARRKFRFNNNNNNVFQLRSVDVRFEVFTAVTMKNGVFWVVPPKRRFLQEPHGVTTQKTPFFKEC
jgi:hypothetical protein